MLEFACDMLEVASLMAEIACHMLEVAWRMLEVAWRTLKVGLCVLQLLQCRFFSSCATTGAGIRSRRRDLSRAQLSLLT